MTSPTRGERQIRLDITTTRSDDTDALPALAAYAFGSGGALIDAQPIDGKGNARLTLQHKPEGDAVRVVLGPQMEKDEVSVGEVLRRGGIDAHVALRADTEKLAPLAFDLTPDLVRPWLGRRCIVKGTLVKRVVSGGFIRDLPVCDAAVDIFEVDPWPRIIPRLPDLELERLRHILDGPWPPIDLPIPPRPVEEFLEELVPDLIGPRALNPQPLPPRSSVRSLTRNDAAIHGVGLPADLQFALRASRPVLERAVLAHVDLLRPILCWLYPSRVRKTKIATAFTDHCGHFRTVIWRSFLDVDVPDLYFTARQRIWPGFWVTIHERTPVACNTWWNYQCGTDVTLITRHPLAHTCQPCPPVIAPRNWVLFMAIGNASTWRIHGVNPSTAVGAPGHDGDKYGLLDDTAPWGGTLRPRLEFDNELRASLGVHYYRIAYKRPGEPDDAWRFSIESIDRHYIQSVAGEPVITQYPLGPQSVGGTPHLYQIPPALPPAGQWSLPNVILDSQSGVIPTTAVAPGSGYDATGTPLGADQGGLWQIRVELFTQAGALVDPEALGIAWRVPESADLTGTIETSNAATLGLVDAARNCMIVTVRVDNNPCFAAIGAPTLDGNAASSGCGVMHYGSLGGSVETPFTALQRNRHADYSFSVQRGEGPGAQLSRTGVAVPASADMPAAPISTVGDLLDGCAIAGFTEQLYVAHRATDGWSRQQQYDRSAARAFVLAPTAPVPVSPIATP